MLDRKTTLLPCLLLAAAGCSSDPASPPADAATPLDSPAMDVAGDAAPDATAPDASPDASQDATPDAPQDAAPEAAVDAGGDASADAATDAAGDAGDPYGCLGSVTAPVGMGAMGTLRLQTRNFQTNAAMSGLTVKACARADTACATPHSMGTTDASGIVTLTYPMGARGFDGYFEVTGGTGSGEVTPTRSFVVPPLTRASEEGSFLLVPRATFTLLGGALGAMLDATHGGITFQVVHCQGAASGAAVTSAPEPAGATRFYIASGLPDPTATRTGTSGQGGYLNVPPGEYTLTASRVTPMTRIGASSITVRGGFLTSTNIAPSP